MPEREVCRERILSVDYRDFIVSELRQNLFTNLITEDTCTQEMQFIYESVYLEKEIADPITFERFSYNSIPKCYTLIDMAAMTQAGITQIQNYPPLNLQGTGVMIGFVDVGID